MESNEQLALRIIAKCQESAPLDKHALISWVENSISWAMDDAFKVIKNINSTSLNDMDAAQRFIGLENKYGIPKTHLILKN